jgi:hypothetical protein
MLVKIYFITFIKVTNGLLNYSNNLFKIIVR